MNWDCSLYPSIWVQGPLVNSCEHDKELSGSLNREHLDQLTSRRLFKSDPTPLSKVIGPKKQTSWQLNCVLSWSKQLPATVRRLRWMQMNRWFPVYRSVSLAWPSIINQFQIRRYNEETSNCLLQSLQRDFIQRMDLLTPGNVSNFPSKLAPNKWSLPPWLFQVVLIIQPLTHVSELFFSPWLVCSCFERNRTVTWAICEMAS
jgi:hypothetical protein